MHSRRWNGIEWRKERGKSGQGFEYMLSPLYSFSIYSLQCLIDKESETQNLSCLHKLTKLRKVWVWSQTWHNPKTMLIPIMNRRFLNYPYFFLKEIYNNCSSDSSEGNPSYAAAWVEYLWLQSLPPHGVRNMMIKEGKKFDQLSLLLWLKSKLIFLRHKIFLFSQISM